MLRLSEYAYCSLACRFRYAPYTAAFKGQATGIQKLGCRGTFHREAGKVITQKSDRAEQQLVKMQVWLVSDDPILVAEAQQFSVSQRQQESVGLVSTDVVLPE